MEVMFSGDQTINVKTEGMLGRKEKVQLGLVTDRLGEKCKFVARNIRSLVMKGWEGELLEADSFNLKQDNLKDEWTMQEHIEVVANLTVAYLDNPSEVIKMLEGVGWSKDMSDWPRDEKDLVENLKKRGVTDKGWVEMLKIAQGELMGNDSWLAGIQDKFVNLEDFAPCMEMFSLIDSTRLRNLIPKSDEREGVTLLSSKTDLKHVKSHLRNVARDLMNDGQIDRAIQLWRAEMEIEGEFF